MTPPVWSAQPPGHKALRDTVSADVVVIGAGFAGLVAAIELAEAGRSVVLLDAADIGQNASGASAGQVGPLFYGARKAPAQVDAVLGVAQAARLHQRVAASGNWLFDMIAARGIDCQARRGFLCVYRSERSLAGAVARFQQWRPHGGVFEPVDAARVRQFIDSDRYAGGVLLPDGGFLNPALLLSGLATAATRAGVAVHPQSAVTALERRDGRWEAQTAGGSVSASQVLVATGSAGLSAWPALARTVYAVPCGIAATAALPPRDRSLLPSGGPVADLDDKAVFAPALTADGRLMVSFLLDSDGPDLRSCTAPARMRLERTFPDRTIPPFETLSWGRLALTPDGLPRLIDGGDGLLAVTGCNGFGLTLGMIAAREAVRFLLGEAAETLALPLTPPTPLPLARVMPTLFRAVLAPLANRLGA